MQGSATDGGPDPGVKKIKVHMDADVEDASDGHKLTEAERRRVRRSVQVIGASVQPACCVSVHPACYASVHPACCVSVPPACFPFVRLPICASCLLSICASAH